MLSSKSLPLREWLRVNEFGFVLDGWKFDEFGQNIKDGGVFLVLDLLDCFRDLLLIFGVINNSGCPGVFFVPVHLLKLLKL